jgi:hypothetical protein
MRGFVVVIFLALVAGCASAPEGEGTPGTKASNECPAWKLVVEEDGRIYCVDRDVLEREREIIEDEEHW